MSLIIVANSIFFLTPQTHPNILYLLVCQCLMFKVVSLSNFLPNHSYPDYVLWEKAFDQGHSHCHEIIWYLWVTFCQSIQIAVILLQAENPHRNFTSEWWIFLTFLNFVVAGFLFLTKMKFKCVVVVTNHLRFLSPALVIFIFE